MLLNAPCSSPVNAVKLTDHLGHMSLLVNDAPVRVVRRSVSEENYVTIKSLQTVSSLSAYSYCDS